MELPRLLWRSKNFNFTLLMLLTLASAILLPQSSHAVVTQTVKRGEPLTLKIANPDGGANRCDWVMPQFDHTIAQTVKKTIEIHEMGEANNPTDVYKCASNNPYLNCTYAPARTAEWLFNPLGSKTNKTACGIDILNVADADSGEWEGDEGIANHEFKVNVQGQAYNTIALDPNPSQNNPIENATIIEERVISENNSTKTRNLTIWCIARQSNPEPSITVRIGDDIVTNKAGTTIEKKPNVSATGDDDYVSPYYPDFSSKVWKWTNMPLEQSYDGKELRCESTTPGFDKQVMAVNISITGPPSTDPNDVTFTGFEGEEIGSEVNLTLDFHSNPPPLEVQWFVHDRSNPIISLVNGETFENENNTIIKVFNESSRYASTTFRKLDGANQINRYLVQLQLRELEKDDEDQTMIIQVENSEGKVNYTVVHQDLQRSGLSNGAIAGIVVGVVVGVILLGAVSFFILKKKGKKSKNINRTNPPIPQQRGRSDDEMIEIQEQQQQPQGVDNPAMSDVEIN